MASQFPKAKEYSWGEKEITVWCSNDYLGKHLSKLYSAVGWYFYYVKIVVLGEKSFRKKAKTFKQGYDSF